MASENAHALALIQTASHFTAPNVLVFFNITYMRLGVRFISGVCEGVTRINHNSDSLCQAKFKQKRKRLNFSVQEFHLVA